MLAWADDDYFAETWGIALLAEAIAIAVWAFLASTTSSGSTSRSSAACSHWPAGSCSRAGGPSRDAACSRRTERSCTPCRGGGCPDDPKPRIDDLVPGVLAGTGIVTVDGLLQHVLGSWVPNGRLESPVGYSNAAGILAAATLLLALGLAADGRRGGARSPQILPQRPRWCSSSSLPRDSRRLRLGIFVLAVSIRPAPSLVRAGPVGSIAGLAALDAGLAGRSATVACPPPSSCRSGRSPRSAAWLPPSGELAGRPRARVAAIEVDARRLRGRPGVVALAVAAVAADDVRGVRSTPAEQQRVPDRLLSTSTSFARDYWDVAAGMVADEPLLGEGAGGFGRIWLRDRPALLFVSDAHNLYLETLAEPGGRSDRACWSRCSYRSPSWGGRCGSRGRACLAAYLALLAHAALDWDWELPAVTVCTVLLAVALLKHGAAHAGAAPVAPTRASVAPRCRRRPRCRGRRRSGPTGPSLPRGTGSTAAMRRARPARPNGSGDPPRGRRAVATAG